MWNMFSYAYFPSIYFEEVSKVFDLLLFFGLLLSFKGSLYNLVHQISFANIFSICGLCSHINIRFRRKEIFLNPAYSFTDCVFSFVCKKVSHSWSSMGVSFIIE